MVSASLLLRLLLCLVAAPRVRLLGGQRLDAHDGGPRAHMLSRRRAQWVEFVRCVSTRFLNELKR
jgi:hypothetical protein